MEFQVEENPVSPALDLPHDGGSLGVEQLHADFQKRFALLVLKEVEEPEGVFRRLEVAGNDYVALHLYSIIPIMSLNFSMPSRSISPGSASTISFEA